MKRPQWFEWLEAQRIRQGLTRRDLASEAGCDPSYLTYLEKTRKVPSVGLTARIGQAIGLQDECLVLAGFQPLNDANWEHLKAGLTDIEGEQEAKLLHEFRRVQPDKRPLVLQFLLCVMEKAV